MEFNAAQVKTEFLGHLGIFTAVIERLGIIEKVNARISVSKEKGSKVSMGVRLAAMILNALGFIDHRVSAHCHYGYSGFSRLDGSSQWKCLGQEGLRSSCLENAQFL